MKIIRKCTCLLLTILLSIHLVGCGLTTTPPSKDEVVEELTILTTNDFHGAIAETGGQYGIARLAQNFKMVKDASKATVIVSAGDMFQGTALSNYNHGKTIVDIMNIMEFDAMTLGNHEFDWGYSEMYQYVDGNTNNGEAKFPFLGCNIIEKATGTLPDGVKAYQIVERGGLKIAIIGYMGYGNESDIATQMIEPYQFVQPVPVIQDLTQKLRTEEKVDVVIVVGHEGKDSNQELALLEGDARIDAIINGHTHIRYTGTLKRSDGVSIPYIQTGSAGENYGVITLNIDKETKQVTGGTALAKANIGEKNDEVAKIVSQLEEETAPVFGRVIGVASSKIERYGAADWAATALWEYAKTDLAVINIGGIRSQAFPIGVGENILVSKIYEIMPFDNVLKTTELYGSDIRTLVNNGSLVKSANVDVRSNTIYINGSPLNDQQKYSVATIDYIFDQKSYPFYKGTNSVNTGVLFRDILIAKVEATQDILIPARGEYDE